jgi:hypothetical protein
MSKNDFFEKFKEDISNLDPVAWAEKYLFLDGKPYRVTKNGYKLHADILRYLAIKAIERDGRVVVWNKGRQIGATSVSSILEMYFMASGLFGKNGRPSIRVIHCFPTLVHVFTYSKTKLSSIISSSLQVAVANSKKKIPFIESLLDKTNPANNSLQYKQFIGGNFLRTESVGIDGSRLAGGSCDALLYDEVQLMSVTAMANVNKLATTAQYGKIGDGIRLYFGTPLARGSEYWKLWNNSTQQYYHLGCEQCKEYFPLYTPESDDWEKIWLYGYVVKCTKCGCEQDKNEAVERGKWIALRPDAEYVGFHMNQLYIPSFTKEYIISQKPENHPINTERAYRNEVLGEFYSGESGIITPEEIQEKCGDMDRRMRANITQADSLNVYAGYDWGKKQADTDNSQGQSYSCAVVLSSDNSGLLSVEFTTMLKRNDFEDKKAIVDQMFRQYNVKLGVGDIGYANDLTEVLQRTHGDKFLGSEATAHLNGHIKYSDDYFPKRIIFEKNYYIEEFYGLLKKGMIRFPYKDYEKIVPLITHICSMEIKTSMNRIGEPQQTYVKNGVNDLMMAAINAYLAYKFDITKGFKNNPHGQNTIGGVSQIPATLAYAPRTR